MKNNSITHLPKSRKDKLIVKELPDETLVYDLETDEAHCLNATATHVWKCCDGRTGVSDIAISLGNETQTPVDDRIVWLALDELEKLKLLDRVPLKSVELAGLNRRQVMRTLGVGAIALPFIISIVAPSAVHAVSCLAPGSTNQPDGCPCVNPGDCQPSHHCTGAGSTCAP